MDVSRYAVLTLGLLVSGCTPDVVSPTGAGGAGAAPSSSASTTTVASSTSVSTVAASTSATASASSSSGTGTSISFPFCEGFSDDFDGYASDAGFIMNGEDTGPWQELPTDGVKVAWSSGAIATEAGMQKFYAALDTVLSIASLPDCAYSIKLVDSIEKEAEFGFQKPAGGEFFGVRYNPMSKMVSAFGGVELGPIDVPFDLAIVHNGTLFFGFVDDGRGWTALEPVGGATASSGFAGSMSFGAQKNFGQATWDDFNVREVPEAAVATTNVSPP